MTGIGVIGVPANSAGTTDGVARAPKALRDAGLVETLQGVIPAVDYGDLDLPAPSSERDPRTHVIDPAGLRGLVRLVGGAVGSIIGDGRFPLVLGGDCPVLLGCLAAFGGAGDRGLLFVDGHEDAYPPARSTTGEAADMELGFALGMVETPWWPELESMSPLISADRLQLLGPRDRALLETEGLESLSSRLPLVDGRRLRADPGGSARMAVASLPPSWWFHLDLDVLSTDALPAVDYPQAGGLDWDDLDVVAAVALAARPVGWDVTIYNPDLDPDRRHARRIVRFIGSQANGIASFTEICGTRVR
jgi:arginase